MKEHSPSIHRGIFEQLSGGVAEQLAQEHILRIRWQIAGLLKAFLPTVLATLAMAAILFTGISLFLVQLAEHGW